MQGRYNQQIQYTTYLFISQITTIQPSVIAR
nr:MAG TPA: hypothetical protein [Caudoviricetes sp.]